MGRLKRKLVSQAKLEGMLRDAGLHEFTLEHDPVTCAFVLTIGSHEANVAIFDDQEEHALEMVRTLTAIEKECRERCPMCGRHYAKVGQTFLSAYED